MDFTDLQARTTALVTLGGWSNASPAPNYATLVNEGLRIFTRETQFNVEDIVIETVANQAAYSLTLTDPRDWVLIFDDALYDVGAALSTLTGAGGLPQRSRSTLRRVYREWRNAASATPQCWFWSAPDTISLWPPPSVSGTYIQFEGVRHSPVLVNGVDIPLFNEDFHEAIALFAAWYWGKLYSRGEERNVAVGYQNEAMAYVNRYKEIMNAAEADLVRRRVGRADQEYIGSGTRSGTSYRP